MMKRLFCTISIILLLFCVVFRSFAYVENHPKIIHIINEGSDRYISWKLVIPKIQGLKSKKVEQDINRRLERTVLNFNERMRAESKESYKESRRAGYPIRPFETQTIYSVHHLDQDILSLTIDIYSYTGGAHGNTIRLAFNYNPDTGKSLGYKDVLIGCDDYKKVIMDNIREKITGGLAGYAYFHDARETLEKFTDEQPFYITEDGIVVYYGLYEIAPYAAGIQEFLIPFTAFISHH